METFRSVIITGTHGMLGRAVTAALNTRNISAIQCDRASGDITNEVKMTRLFAEHRPTLLLNCAAYTWVDSCEAEAKIANTVNGDTVGLLARLCREYDTYLVHFSTDAVFDGRGDRPYLPTDAVGPLSAYARSKLLGEQQLQQFAPRRWMIVRTAWLFGEGGRCFPRMVAERLRHGEKLQIVDDQFGSPTYSRDLAEATLDLVGGAAQGIWHVTNAGTASWFELAVATAHAFALGANVSPITTDQWLKLRPKQAKRTRYSVLDTKACASKLGRTMRSWHEALRACCLSVQSQGGF